MVCLGICCPDPCTNHRPLNEETRAVDHSLGLSETESCDRLISEDWYVLQDNGTIPTECPPLLRCGSTGPIWMNGILKHKCIIYFTTYRLKVSTNNFFIFLMTEKINIFQQPFKNVTFAFLFVTEKNVFCPHFELMLR